MKTWSALLALLVAGVLIRVLLALVYEPTVWPDTGSYFEAAHDIVNGGLSASQGRRTPGYPALIALGNFSPHMIIVLQSLGGILTSALLFHIALSVTGQPWLAFIVAMTYNLNVQQLSIEWALLSESTCTLMVMSVVAGMIVLLRRVRDRHPLVPLLALMVGTLGGAAILIRPQYIFLILLLPAVVVYATGKGWFRNHVSWRTGAIVVAPPLVMVLAWCSAVYVNTGYFTLSTQSGFSVINHSVGFVEYAPERYETIREILLKHRETKLMEQGHYGNTGWLALPDIRQATGMNLPQVSREFQKMSTELFIAHPVLYARSVLMSWIDFWTVPLVWQPERISQPSVVHAVEAVWWLEHKLLRLANVLFIALIALVVLSARVRATTAWSLEMTVVAAMILLSSLIQALADYGASSRYAITVQALVVFLVFATSFQFRQRGTELAKSASIPSKDWGD